MTLHLTRHLSKEHRQFGEIIIDQARVNGLTDDEVTVLEENVAQPKHVLIEMRNALLAGNTPSNTARLLQYPNLTQSQLREVRIAISDGLSDTVIRQFAKPHYQARQMFYLRTFYTRRNKGNKQ